MCIQKFNEISRSIQRNKKKDKELLTENTNEDSYTIKCENKKTDKIKMEDSFVEKSTQLEKRKEMYRKLPLKETKMILPENILKKDKEIKANQLNKRSTK